MPWRWMMLRGQRVLARCRDDGALVDEEGRVEIRYRANDGKAYFAAKRNLGSIDEAPLLPDAHCGEAERAAPAAKDATSSGGKGTLGKKRSATKTAAPPEKPSGSEVLVYADGACSGNPGPAGLGVVMLWDDERRELAEFLGRGTNNVAELTAILRAAEATPDPSRPLRIYTDSNYSIGVLTRGWKAKANVELVAEVKRALGKLSDVELRHVPGHAGVPLNERADQLARLAIEIRSSTGWITPPRAG